MIEALHEVEARKQLLLLRDSGSDETLTWEFPKIGDPDIVLKIPNPDYMAAPPPPQFSKTPT